MAAIEQQIMKALETVNDPELHRDLVSLGMVKGVKVEGGVATVTIQLTTPACPLKSVIQKDVETALLPIEGVDAVRLDFTANVKGSNRDGMEENLIPQVKNTILVGSGKGGVGKSTVALNIALALAKLGAKVGILDADIYGPSLPTMLNAVNEQPGMNPETEKISPLEVYGLKAMSVGFLIEPNSPVIWRGPLLQNLITQFLRDVEWGELDYLVVDLPPGTGDVQLAFAQKIRPTGAVLVTTPQDVALADVYRAKYMFDKVEIPILGVVENMASFICPDCGKLHQIFSGKGAKAAAVELGITVLGSIPLHPAISVSGDAGRPFVLDNEDSLYTNEIVSIAGKLAAAVSTLVHS
jgi:ATP-binding protein involved in chromosome partitioning